MVAFSVLLSPTPRDAGANTSPAPIASSISTPQVIPSRAAHQSWLYPRSPQDQGTGSTIIDTFTDTSGTLLTAHTPDAGGSWTQHPSYATDTAVISSANRARPGTGPDTQALLYWSGNPASPDYSVSADASYLTATGFGGVIGRADTSVDTCYFARFVGGSGALELGKHVSGTETILATVAPGWSTGVTHNLSLSMQGTSISMWVDSVLTLGPVTDSSISAAGKLGVYLASLNVASPDAKQVQLDNLTLSGPASSTAAPILASAPHRASGPARAAESNYWIGNAPLLPPVNPGYVGPGGPRLPGSYLFRRLPRLANYTWLVRGPIDTTDPGLPPIHAVVPDRAQASARILFQPCVPSPVDQGIVPPPPIAAQVPDRAITVPRLGSHQVVQASKPDAGLPQPIVQPSYPDRASGPQRASWIPGVTPPPPDFGIIQPMPIAASMPHRANGPRMWSAGLQVSLAAREDVGLPQPIVQTVYPDVARGPRRTANTAYTIAQASRPDAGLPQPIIFPIWPDEARKSRPYGPQQWMAQRQWIVQSPHEPGTQPIIAAQLPTRPSGPSRSAPIAYQITNRSPLNSGTPPIPVSMPHRAEGARRAAWMPFSVPSPKEVGTRPIAASMPDRASAPRRAAWTPMSTPTPLPAPIIPLRRSIPDRAERARRAAGVAYQISTPPPHDPGQRPIAARFPDRAPGHRHTQGSFVVLKPRDAGRTPVRGFVTHAATGARRTAASAYHVLVQAMHDAGKRPIQGLLPVQAPGHRPRLANYQIAVRSPVDSGIVVVRPIFVDPRAATEIYEDAVIVELDTGTNVEPDPRAVTIVYTSTQAQPDPRFATVIL